MAFNLDDYEPIDEDSFNYGSGGKNSTLSYKTIVINQFNKCAIEGSKQMAGVGNHYSKIGDTWIKINAADQRRIYIEAVKTLYDLLFRYFDKEAKENINKLQNDINNSKDDYFKLYVKSETYEDYRNLALSKKEIITGSHSNVGNLILQQYEENKVNIYRKIFRELTLLYDRQNELSNEYTLDPDAMSVD